MQSFLYMKGNAFPSLLFRQAKGCIKVGEPVEPSTAPSNGCSSAAPVTPGFARTPALKCKRTSALLLRSFYHT